MKCAVQSGWADVGPVWEAPDGPSDIMLYVVAVLLKALSR
jgi:hypothetical protein